MAAPKLMMIAAFIAVASFWVPSTMAQTRHVVGDSFGWNIPSSNGIYTTWASQQTFNVGDTLFFNFTTGFHDVAEVTQTAYGPCTTTNPISSNTTGPVTLTLTNPGNHYYICTVGAGAHCQAGQKVTINVAAATGTPTSTSPPPAGSTTPPPAVSTPPSPPSPPSPSSATSFSAVGSITFLAAASAFFY